MQTSREPSTDVDVEFVLKQARAARLTGQFLKAVLLLQSLSEKGRDEHEEVAKETSRLCTKIISECWRIPQAGPLKKVVK